MSSAGFLLAVLCWLAAVGLLRRFARRWGGLWADVLAAGLLWLLVTGFFWRTLSGDVYQPADGGDLASFLFPTYRFAAATLAQGLLPLWNPTLYGGAPFIGDIQSGFFYPYNLLLFWGTPNFSYQALQGAAIAHLFWAGLGMYLLLRTLRWPQEPVSRPAALFAALVFALADPLLLHLGNLNLIAVLSWLPWVLAAFVQGLSTGQWRWSALAGLLFALAISAGHAQSALYIGLALLLLALGWSLAVPEMARGELAARLAAVLLLAALLAAPVLLPAFELTRYAMRSEFTYQETVAFSLAPTQLLAGLVTPSLFGRGPALHWGLWERVELPYLGVPALLLALAGLVLAWPEARRRLWLWGALAVFGLLVALGAYTVVHGWLTLILPFFDQLRAPARALVLWALGMGVLSAVGFEAIAQRLARARFLDRFLQAGALLLALATLLFVGLLFVTQADSTAFLRASLAALASAIALGSWLGTWGLVVARQQQRLGAALFAVLTTGLLFLELAAAGAYTDVSEQDPTLGFQQDEVIAFLRSDPDLFRIDTRTGLDGLWQPDTAALAGLQDIGGISNPLALRSYHTFWEESGGRATRQYDLLNIKYVLVKEGTPLPEGKFVKVLGPLQGIEVYANQDWLPRAWVAPADAELSALLPPAAPPAAQPLAYSPTAMQFEVTAPEAGWLVISEFWYPGWDATVNGTASPIEQVNGALRAVAVPAGRSVVALAYRPASFAWGLVGFAVGILLLAGLAFWRWRAGGRL
jgi:hypothetical protein